MNRYTTFDDDDCFIVRNDGVGIGIAQSAKDAEAITSELNRLEASKLLQSDDIARRIFDRLDVDIRDRKGLKQEWGAIDDKVMNEELRPAWAKIIAEEISRLT